ncbi:MAG: hypothetical protein DLM68_09245, partial [Hyphomicrobiales bacterium]
MAETNCARWRRSQRASKRATIRFVGASLDASRFLTGMPPVAQAHIRAMWAQKRMPAEVARIKVLEAAEHLNRGGTLLIDYQRKCADQVIVAQAKARATRPALRLSRRRCVLCHLGLCDYAIHHDA